tara:strand:- start:124 stop:486 length:363 start_codon:yes stop_codon:yes gene_type:complete
MNHKEDYLQIDAQTMITELRKLSDKYCHCYGEKIDLETAIKRKEADLYFKYKAKSVGEKITQKDIEYQIKTDPEYSFLRVKLDEADKEYIKAKNNFNNKQTAISLLQSELKRELIMQRSN